MHIVGQKLMKENPMTIKQLLEMPVDKDKSKCGGFQLKVRIARKTIEYGKGHLQAVTFIDDAGDEMPGDIVLPKYIPVQRNAKIHITICWLKQGETGPKLWVEQWYPVTMTELDICTQRANFNDEMQYGEPLHIVESKVRMHVVCAILSTANDYDKEFVNNAVDFIITGE